MKALSPVLAYCLISLMGCNDDIGYASHTAPIPDAATAQPDPPEDTPDLRPPEPNPELCLDGSEGVDFGVVEVGGVAEQNVEVFNCAEQGEVEITSIALGSDSDGAFSLSDPPEAARLGPGESLSVRVALAPEQGRRYTGSLVFVSGAGVLEVSLRGRGDQTRCPTAIARARVEGSDAPWSTQVSAAPLDTMRFEGDDSQAEGDPPLHYVWAIVEQPRGSESRLVPFEQAANPTLFLDLAGVYIVELTVYDLQGTPSCEPARVTVQAIPNTGVFVQLTWDVEDTDMDLHFLHPNGHWNQSPYDCYWLNRNPNWGDVHSSDDDPNLDIDSVDGRVPEYLIFERPEDALYRVGVFSVSQSRATVRVWLNSVLAFEHRSEPLSFNQFWEVAEIEWDESPTVEAIDQITEGFP